jgi:hypothetical protein
MSQAVVQYKCKNHGSRKGRNGFSEKGEPVKSSNTFHTSGSSPTEHPVFDFVVRDEGTIWLFTPLTPVASQFLFDHIHEDAQYFGPSLAVEHRYVYDLLVGLREHGLRAVRE